MILDPVEAPLLAEVYRKIAAGGSIRSANRWLAAQKGGRAMAPSVLTRLLKNPRNAGKVKHRGTVVCDRTDGLALIDLDTWKRVNDILSDPARKMSPGRPTVTLFGGILRCYCGEPMSATAKDGVKMYGCNSAGTHSYRRPRALLDEPLLDLLGAVLHGLEEAGLLPAQAPARDPEAQNIAALEARLSACRAKGVSGEMHMDDVADMTRALRADIAEAEERRAKATSRQVTVSGSAAWDVLVKRWRASKGAEVDDLRAVIKQLVEYIEVREAAVYRKPAVSDVKVEWAEWIPRRDLLPTAPEATVSA